MEVDIPQLNGFPVQPTFVAGDNPTAGSHVQFNSIAEVKTYKVVGNQEQQQAMLQQQPGHHQAQRPKHKARRRARVPKLDLLQDDDPNAMGADVSKPLSPSKLKKMMDKDRHSRTGRRGLPKKGKRALQNCLYVYNLTFFGVFIYTALPVHPVTCKKKKKKKTC